MQKTRLLSLILIMSMLFSLTACGTNEQSDPQRPDIARLAVWLQVHALGREIALRATHAVLDFPRGIHVLRDPEVAQLHVPVRVEEDIRGFEVSVEDVEVLVEVEQAVQDL